MARRKLMEILLVEDSPDDVVFTREALADAEFPTRLHVTRDGEEAMRFLRHEGPHTAAPRPDLVPLDLDMPPKAGREVLEEVKEDPELKAIPVVVLTSSSADEDVHHAHCAHVNSYVREPVNYDRFFEVVRTLERYWTGIVTLPGQASAR